MSEPKSEPKQISPDFIKKLDEIIKKIEESGGLIVSGSNQSGKTNAVMWIARRIRDSPKHSTNEYKLTIFDDTLNWKFKFDSIPFVDYAKTSVIPFEEQDLIVNLHEIADIIDVKNVIADLMYRDFMHKHELKNSLNGVVPFANFYVIEEIQNVLGRNGLGLKSGRFLYKLYCECTNFRMVVIGLTQRLADVDTRVVERRRYFLIGRTCGDNDVQKISRMFGSQVADKVKTLKTNFEEGISEFIFYDKAENHAYLIQFPKFEGIGKPFEHKGKSRFIGDVKPLW
jgi:hypothetical protein